MTAKPSKLEKIARPRMADLAADRISEWIASSRLGPGSKLPSEQALMEALGLGRSAIREALAKLKAVGLVETFQGRGAFVAEMPVELMRDRIRRLSVPLDDPLERLEHIWELREIFETAIADRAAQRRTDEDLVDLQAAVANMDRAIAQGERAVEQDAMFHYCLARACHNSVLLDLIEDVSNLIESSRRDSLQRPGRPKSSNREHDAILDAVRRRDAAAARAAMQEHLANGRRQDGDEPR